jgi:hypothetical protein
MTSGARCLSHGTVFVRRISTGQDHVDKIMLTDPKNCLCIFRECDKLVLKTIIYKKANDEPGWDTEVQDDDNVDGADENVDGDDQDGETVDH